MTASEARKRSEEVRERNSFNEFTQVMEDIEIAVRDGKYTTNYYKSLSQDTIDRLEKEPNLYKIQVVADSRDGDFYTISW